jgi:hypothetical protein
VSYREVPVHQVREVIRLWLAGEGIRSTARLAQLDRKTVGRYVEAARVVGLSRDGGLDQLTDEAVGLVCELVRPARRDGRGRAWMALEENGDLVSGWVKAEVPLTKVQVLLARRGIQVPYRTLNRFAIERCEFGVWPGDSSGGRRGARSGMPDRFRPDGSCSRPRRGPQTGVSGLDLHRLLQPAQFRVAELRSTLGGCDRRLRGRLEFLRRSLEGPSPRKCSAEHF